VLASFGVRGRWRIVPQLRLQKRQEHAHGSGQGAAAQDLQLAARALMPG